jgi:hypothetical protein
MVIMMAVADITQVAKAADTIRATTMGHANQEAAAQLVTAAAGAPGVMVEVIFKIKDTQWDVKHVQQEQMLQPQQV